MTTTPAQSTNDESATAVAPQPSAARSSIGIESDQPSADGAASRHASRSSKVVVTASGRANPGRIDRIEAWVSRLSGKSRFWQRISSLIWLPMAFRSGIRMRKRKLDAKTFTAVLPFRRFNRNWYNAMAGAALLANSEIAGGMYVFGVCGGEYECVCKKLRYRFLRPCYGPAIYKVKPRNDIEALVATGEEFNIDMVLDIVQEVHKRGEKDRRVGRCYATFHATPKMHQKAKRIENRTKKK